MYIYIFQIMGSSFSHLEDVNVRASASSPEDVNVSVMNPPILFIASY